MIVTSNIRWAQPSLPLKVTEQTHLFQTHHVQEVAGNHGVALWGRTEEGFATDPIMVAHNLIFVATRIQIQMDSYPKW